MFKILYQRPKSKTTEGPDGKAEARMETGGPVIKVGIGVESRDDQDPGILRETGGPVIEIETGGPVVKAGRGTRGARRPCHLSRDMSRGKRPYNRSRDRSRNRRPCQHSRDE